MRSTLASGPPSPSPARSRASPDVLAAPRAAPSPASPHHTLSQYRTHLQPPITRHYLSTAHTCSLP
eukprot:804325-Rhodomonas_salina.1